MLNKLGRNQIAECILAPEKKRLLTLLRDVLGQPLAQNETKCVIRRNS